MPVVRKTRKAKEPRTGPKNWQDAIRLYFAKVAEADAVFVAEDNNVVHVYSVVRDFADSIYPGLLKQERRIEKAFPEVAFEFHARAHQGRKPFLAVPFGAEAVFVR